MERALLVFGWLVAGCGVLATEGSGDDNLPDARFGPFRTFGEGEVTLPPMAVLDFGAALGGPDVARSREGGFVLTMHAAPDDDEVTVLRRMSGETPTVFADPEILLEGEPEGLRDPAVIEDGAQTLLWFGLGSGAQIGVARSTGGPFVRDDEPVLIADDLQDEPIGAPTVAVIGGQWFLYYERGDAIALAVSADGRTFQDEGEVLGPGEGWDAGGVGDPEVVVARSSLGETRVRLYYTGWSTDDPPVRGVGVAASFDGRSDFHRFVGNPLVALDGDEAAPAVAPGEGDAPTFLYFERASGSGRLGIGGAVLPAEVSLAAE